MSAGPGWLTAFGPVAGADPFGGFTGFGFDIPQGDPAAIAFAADGLRRLGPALADQGDALAAAARVALGGGAWGGAAANAYASYSGHVVHVCAANAAACGAAASVLSSFASELEHAQSATRQALADCARYQAELASQQTSADAAGQDARIASGIASALPHPARAEFDRQATAAEQRQASAHAAAAAAGNELQYARRQGSQASEAYQHDAQAVAGRLQSLADELRPAPPLPGGGLVPISVTRTDATLGAAMAAALPTAAGSPGASGELPHPAGGPVSPGAALQFIRDYRSKQQLAQLAAEDKPLDGSVAGTLGSPVAAVVNAIGGLASGLTGGTVHVPGANSQTGSYRAGGLLSWVPFSPASIARDGEGILARVVVDDAVRTAEKGGPALTSTSDAAFRAADDAGAWTVTAKHLPGSRGNWAKFGGSIDPREAAQEALRSPNAEFRPNPTGAPATFLVRADLGRVVGSRGQTAVRVIVSNDGRIITAFPVK